MIPLYFPAHVCPVPSQGTRYGAAVGFKVWGESGAMAKMRDLKDNDGVRTLLTFTAACCLRQHAGFAEIFPEKQLAAFKSASMLDMREIVSFIADLAKGVNMMRRLLSDARLGEGVYQDTLGPFHHAAVQRIADLSERYVDC